MRKLICQLLGIFLIAQIQQTSAGTVVPYAWSNLPIGGHGFVTGIVMHPLEKDLMYIRTDVGGAYRWDKENKSWIQLCDGFGVEEQNFYGIAGVAIDPLNTNVVYIAAGAYTWAGADVLKSTDRGRTWARTGLNKKFEANGSRRAMGECIVVDPVNSSVVYCGTTMDGLWRSLDGASSWEKVAAITTLTDKTNEIRNIVFDKNSTSGGKSQIIYAGVTNKGVYRSINGGQAWTLLAGTPLTAKRMEVGPSGALYVASDKGLFKFSNEIWSEISAPGQIGKSHNGVAIDPTNENNLVCVAYSSNLMQLPILRSTDGGKTWVNKISTAQLVSPIVPWEVNDPNGSFTANTADIKIDPLNPKRVMVCDFFAPYITEDITAEPKQIWSCPIKGIEEVVARDLISQPSGKFSVITAIADIDGLPFEDVNQYPTRMIRVKRQTAWEAWMMSSSQIDFCEEDPNIMLRVGIDWNTNGKAEYTTNNADSWTNITNVRSYMNGSGAKTTAVPFARAAVSAKKNPETGNPAFVVIPAYNVKTGQTLPAGQNTLPMVSLDMGNTWQEVKGFPAGTNILFDHWNMQFPIASDRVNGSKFYICAANNVYVSEDWGFNWTKTFKIDGDVNQTIIHAAPNMEGEVWVGMGSSGIFRSTDSGKSFNKLSNVSWCKAFGFGKEATGAKNPTIYLFGTVNGANGMYRSIDMGASWEKINDDSSKFGVGPTCIVGDRRTFGRVYVGTNGRGFYVGSDNPVPNTKVLKDKNGVAMRGTPMILGKTLDQSVAFAQNIENWKTIQNNGFNTIRLCWVDPYYKDHSQVNWPVSEVLPHLDKCVENATATGMNLIINFHNVGAQQNFDKTYQFSLENEFWNAIAPRYKNNDLVYYEPVNEPTFTMSDYLKSDFKAAYLKLYDNIRTLAPERQILFFSFNGITPEIVNMVENYKDQIDWTHTAVAYHMYNSNTSAAIKTLMVNYPVFCTEWNYDFVSKLPDFGFIKQVDGTKENAQILEELGSGWIDWRNWEDITLNELVDTLITDARKKNYWWGEPVSGLKTTGISISDKKIDLVSGKSKQLKTFVYPALAEDQKVNWTSNDENIVTVNANGLVMPNSTRNATAVITAKTNDGGFTAACQVNILASEAKKAYPEGLPFAIPGIINPTYYDQGGEGVGYHDLTAKNDGDGIRKDQGVDTEYRLPEGTIGGIGHKEWLEYTIDVLQDANYTLEILFATTGRYGKFHVEFDGIDQTGLTSVTPSGNYSKFVKTEISGIALKKGVQVMRIFFDFAEYNMGRIELVREIPVGLINPQNNKEVSIFPSPVKDHLFISGNQIFTKYEILSVYGQVLKQGNISELIDVKFLPGGNYLIRLVGENTFLIKKFIKS